MFITATLIFLLGIVVLIRERGSLESRLFFLTILSASVWFYAFSWMYCSTEEPLAKWWAKAAYLGIPFIPSGIYHFTTAVLRLNQLWKRWAAWSWFFSAFFAISIVGTDALISHVQHYWWGFYPRYGWLSIFYLTFFFGMMGFSLFQFWDAARRAQPGTIYQRRAKLLLGAFAIACIGAVDYLPKYGIAIYPFGYIPIFFFLILTARVIWKYRLVDITAAFAADRIIETMKEPLIVCDSNGSICVANQTACKTFGYQMKELVRSSIEILAGQGHSEQGRLWASISVERAKDRETLFYTKQGKPVYVSFSVAVLEHQDSSLLGYVMVARDITERKRIEEKMTELNETLEKRVQERTQQLESKLIELKQLNQIMMGREERILELKTQLKDLQKRLGEDSSL